jgi:hypothetical protein
MGEAGVLGIGWRDRRKKCGCRDGERKYMKEDPERLIPCLSRLTAFTDV